MDRVYFDKGRHSTKYILWYEGCMLWPYLTLLADKTRNKRARAIRKYIQKRRNGVFLVL